MSEPVRIDAGEGEAGERLDVVVGAAVGSRSAAARLISDGRVIVDGRRRAKRHVVSDGETIVIHAARRGAPDAEPEVAAPFEVVFEDEHLLVIDKPAGMVVHPARGHRTGTLAQALAGRAAGGEDEERAGIVHRLDRDTSGLLVVARSEPVHRALRGALSARELRREYLALVAGRPESRTGTIEAAIGRDRRDRTRVSTDTDVPREARTHFEIERALARTTLLRVTLDTGRTHQIRVHLGAIGLPVLGDPVYGAAGRLGLHRQFLHAARLSFEHPATGEPLDLRSPLPADLRQALSRAEAGEG